MGLLASGAESQSVSSLAEASQELPVTGDWSSVAVPCTAKNSPPGLRPGG
jgi:hypothetical protein